MRNCASENLEIPGLVLTHHPGMTELAAPIFYGLISAWTSARKAWREASRE
jgi:hypothetical protein